MGCIAQPVKGDNVINKKTTTLVSPLLALFLLGINPSVAGNMKGNLESNELAFFEHTVYPILIDAGICTSATKDCIGGNHFICSSSDSLSCEVYGITDDKVVRQIFLAFFNSGLRISSLKFWRSNYHEGGLFEKPLLSFTDHTDDKK